MEKPYPIGTKKSIDTSDFADYLLRKYKTNDSDEGVAEIRRWLSEYLEKSIGTVNLTNTSTISDISTDQYCDIDFLTEPYKNVHWGVTLTIACIGVITNLLILLVLTKKHMQSATNTILLGIAIADLIVSLEYIPYALTECFGSQLLKNQRPHAVYILARAHFSQVSHTVAIWLTSILALWRWASVCKPHTLGTVCTPPLAKRVVLGTYLICPILSAPTFLLTSVQESRQNGDVHYKVNFSELVVENEVVWKVIFFVYSVVVKILPCVCLALLIPAIILEMRRAASRRRLLKSNSMPISESQHKISPKSTDRKKELATERTTRMLVAVLILFLVVELPQGILTGLTLIYGQDFFMNCYMPLSDMMDLLALVNTTLNFAIYYVMSYDFRTAFTNMVKDSSRSAHYNPPI